MPVHPHTISDPALWMDRLAAVFRSCDYKTSQGETHPGLMAAQEVGLMTGHKLIDKVERWRD